MHRQSEDGPCGCVGRISRAGRTARDPALRGIGRRFRDAQGARRLRSLADLAGQGVLASLAETRGDPVAAERLERAAELLVSGGAPVDEAMLDAALGTGSGRVVQVLAGAAPASVDLWEFGLRCTRSLIHDMKDNHVQREEIDRRCAEVAKEQQEVHETLWGKRAELAHSMLEKKLEKLKLDHAKIPSADDLASREVVCGELLSSGRRPAPRKSEQPRTVSPELEQAEKKLEQILADQPAGWPYASRLGAVVNIAKVHGDKILLQLAQSRQQLAVSQGPSHDAVSDPLDLGLEMAFLSHRRTARLAAEAQQMAPPPEKVLMCIVAGSGPGSADVALRRAVERTCVCTMVAEPSRADVAAWYDILKALLQAGANPTAPNPDTGISALQHAINKKDEATIVLLVEHALPECQQLALDALVDVLAANEGGASKPVPSKPSVDGARDQLARAQQSGDTAAIQRAQQVLAEVEQAVDAARDELAHAEQSGNPAAIENARRSLALAESGGVGGPSSPQQATNAATAAFFDITEHHTADNALAHMGAHGGTLMLRACESGDLQMIRKLLQQGVPADAGPGLLQCILDQMYHCPMEQQLEIAQDLILARADLNQADKFHKFPIQSAIDLDNGPLLHLMLDEGANPSVGNMLHYVLSKMLLNTRGSPKWELLQSMLDMLVENHADPLYHGGEFVTGSESDGYYPLDLALVLDNNPVVWLLKLSGAEDGESHALHALLSELCTDQEVELGESNMIMAKETDEVWTSHSDQHGAVWDTVRKTKKSWGAVQKASTSVMKQGEKGLKEDEMRNMEVPVHKIQVISVKTQGHVLGNRPAVPIGGCSLDKWKRNNHALLKSSLQANPKGVLVEFTVDITPLAPGDPTDTIKVFMVNKDTESLPVPLYRGYIRTENECGMLSKRLMDCRVTYLESKCLQLVESGHGLKAPSGVQVSPLMMAVGGGVSDVARAMVKADGGHLGFNDVQQMLAVLPKDGDTKGMRGSHGCNSDLVSELIADVVAKSEMEPEQLSQLLESSVRQCMVDPVRQLLSKDSGMENKRALKEKSYLHMAIECLEHSPDLAADYKTIIGYLLNGGADPNQMQRSKTPLALALAPPCDDDHLAIATLLIESGAKFTDKDFIGMLEQWDASQDPKRSDLLEYMISGMIEKGANTSATLRRGGVSTTLLDVALEKQSGVILAKLFEAHKEAIMSNSPDSERLLEPFCQLLVSLCHGHVALSGDEDGSRSTELKVEIASTLSNAGVPVLHRVLEADPTGGSLISLLDEITIEEASIDLTTTNETGMTILHQTCAEHNLGATEKLFELNGQLAELNPDGALPVNAEDNAGRTALGIAVGLGSSELVAILAAPPPEGGGAQVTGSLLYPAVLAGPRSMIEALIADDVAEVRSDFGRTVLHAAALREQPEAGEIAQMLLDAGVPLEERDVGGATPLLLAVRNKNTEVMQVLLQHGASPSAADKLGNSPLQEEMSSSGGLSELGEAMLSSVGPATLANNEQVILEAVRNKNFEVLDRLGVDGGSDIKLYGAPGKPLVWWAAFFGHTDMVNSWAENLPRALDYKSRNNGRRLWHYMAIWGTSLGAIPSLLSLELPPQEGHSKSSQAPDEINPVSIPLELAAKYGRSAMVEALLPEAVLPANRRWSSLANECMENGLVGLRDKFNALADPEAPATQNSLDGPRDIASATELATREGAPFRDPEFPCGVAALGSNDLIKLAYSEIEWIQCSKLCGGESSVLFANMDKTPGKMNFGSPFIWNALALMDGGQIKSLFQDASKIAMGKYTVNVAWEGELQPVVIDEWVPVLGAANEPEGAFGSMGAGNEMWSHLYLKAMAKRAGGYAQLLNLDTDKMSPYTRSLANEVMPGADPQQMALLLPALSVAQMVRATLPNQGVSDVELVNAVVADFSGGTAEAMATGEKDPADTGSELPTYEVVVHEADYIQFFFSGLVPHDLHVVCRSASGKEQMYPMDPQTYATAEIDLEEYESPYEISVSSELAAPADLKAFTTEIDADPSKMTITPITR